MRFMEEKAAERHPDCLISNSFSVVSLQMHEEAIQVMLYSSGSLSMSLRCYRSLRQGIQQVR